MTFVKNAEKLYFLIRVTAGFSIEGTSPPICVKKRCCGYFNFISVVSSMVNLRKLLRKSQIYVEHPWKCV
jgi:hypothetical protein